MSKDPAKVTRRRFVRRAAGAVAAAPLLVPGAALGNEDVIPVRFEKEPKHGQGGSFIVDDQDFEHGRIHSFAAASRRNMGVNSHRQIR